jgi:hypothetical protein
MNKKYLPQPSYRGQDTQNTQKGKKGLNHRIHRRHRKGVVFSSPKMFLIWGLHMRLRKAAGAAQAQVREEGVVCG